MTSFRELGLSEELLKLLEKAGLETPSEIQEKAIPLVLQGKDVIGGSYTGSGKTLAFGTGIIEKTNPRAGLQVLILTPTRELAEQIGKVFKHFSTYKRLNISMVYGGVSINPQIGSLRYSEIVIGTPGRILDHIERRTINLSQLKVLVLDEADRMLDMGFIDDVEKIIHQCPKERQTLLFSATISSDIAHIAKKHMKHPENVSVESYVSTEKLKQIYYDVPKEMKFSLFVHLLKKEREGLVMVFCNTRHNTDFVANNLNHLGIDALAIHGGLTQDKRNRIMDRFHGKNVHVLVCTDIAARGLDIKGVSHVYNYDIPKTSKEYIHRIGRTARAGKEGIAVNIVSERDYENFNEVLRDESLKIEEEKLPEVERVVVKISGFGRRESYGRESYVRPHQGGRGYNRREHLGRSFGGEGKSYGREERSYGRPNVASHRSFNRRGDSHPRKFFGNRRNTRRDGRSHGSNFGRRDDRRPRRSFSSNRRY